MKEDLIQTFRDNETEYEKLKLKKDLDEDIDDAYDPHYI